MPDTDARLDKIERKIDKIANTIQQIAVQDERIRHIEMGVKELGKKHDAFCVPGGELDRIQRQQASCPRNQIKWLWITLIPLGVSWLAAAYALINMGHKP